MKTIKNKNTMKKKDLKMENVKSETEQFVDHFNKLGKNIKIDKNSRVVVNRPGYKKQYFVESVEVTMGIGKDHTATLSMDIESWEALRSGEKVNITTLDKFKKKFL